MILARRHVFAMHGPQVSCQADGDLLPVGDAVTSAKPDFGLFRLAPDHARRRRVVLRPSARLP